MLAFGGTRLWLVGWLGILVCVALADAAVWRSLGSCPPGVKKDQTWYPKEQECAQCTCFGENQGYSCASCGSISMHVPDGCHAAQRFPGARYPDCCNKMVVCPEQNDQRMDQILS